MTTLLISLPLPGSDTSPLYDYVLSTDGQTVSSHASAALALLPQGADEMVALVPARALSWHLLSLPEGSLPRGLGSERGSARLRSILEGMLEDQLLDEPAQLHLALQPQATIGSPVWVAACDKTWLNGALQALAQAGLSVKRIVPEYSPQGLQGVVLVTGEAQAPQVAGLLYAPAAADGTAPKATGLLVHALDLASVAWLQSPSLALTQVIAEPAVAGVAENHFKRPVALVQHPERLLQAAQSPWDLAQFDLAHADRTRRVALVTGAFKQFLHAPAWRAARLALLATVAVNLVGMNALALQEQAALRAKALAVRTVLTSTFPKIPVVVDAPLQMGREVTALERSTGVSAAHDLENMLSTFSAVAPDKYTLTAIEYAANELRIKGAAVPDVASLVSRLQTLGLRASQQGEQWLITSVGQP